MPFVPCDQCGKIKEFSKSRLQRNKHNFCSKECSNKWLSINCVGENHPAFGKKRPESVGKNISEALKDRVITPEWRENIRQSRLGTHATQATKDLMSEQRQGENHPLFGKSPSKETRNKIAKTLSEYTPTEESKRKKGIANIKRYKDPNERKKTSDAMQKYFEDPEKRKERGEQIKKGLLNYCWYGSVTYPDKKIYCEKWNPDLRKRIRAYWENKSVLSGKTKNDNNNQELSCHHVYYQEKACCIWDEDVQGYYAMINIGTNWRPKMHKYYLRGDPNKFVTLTADEHGMVAKDKLKWITIFEDLIEEQDGKCYYTEEEMKNIKNNPKQPKPLNSSPDI